MLNRKEDHVPKAVTWKQFIELIPEPMRPRYLYRIDHAESGCWLWTAAKTPAGYGRLTFRYQQLYAHVVALKAVGRHRGKPWVVDHLCRTPACVNPNHLEMVSNRENTVRGAGCARPICPRGHLLAGCNLSPAALARGHRECNACNVIRVRTWRQRKRLEKENG